MKFKFNIIYIMNILFFKLNSTIIKKISVNNFYLLIFKQNFSNYITFFNKFFFNKTYI